MIQVVMVDDDLWVVNLAGQRGYGTSGVHTDYVAHTVAWPKVRSVAKKLNLPVYAPWMIGCGLGGGDWDRLRPIIEKHCPEVIWVKNEGS